MKVCLSLCLVQWMYAWVRGSRTVGGTRCTHARQPQDAHQPRPLTHTTPYESLNDVRTHPAGCVCATRRQRSVRGRTRAPARADDGIPADGCAPPRTPWEILLRAFMCASGQCLRGGEREAACHAWAQSPSPQPYPTARSLTKPHTHRPRLSLALNCAGAQYALPPTKPSTRLGPSLASQAGSMRCALSPTPLKHRPPGQACSTRCALTRQPQFVAAGVQYALRRGGRLLFGDEMGLGKTVQALAVVSAYRPEWPCLVITPASLKGAPVHTLACSHILSYVTAHRGASLTLRQA